MKSARSLSSSIPATSQVLAEAEALSEAILGDIELSQGPLSAVVLKAMRLARLLNDFEAQQTFEWESGGYPSGESGVNDEARETAVRAGRRQFRTDPSSEMRRPTLYTGSIEQLEHAISIGTASLPAAGTASERTKFHRAINRASGLLASRRTLIYNYVLRQHYELKLAGLADNGFGRIRTSVDASIGLVVPNAVRKLTAISDNLNSDNPEDWANAAHGCRRALQDLADAIFPAEDNPRRRMVNGKEIEINLGAEHYINRLVAFVEDSSESSRFRQIVGSHLHYMGDRLDALFGAAQKGSHAAVTKEEADRCVVYTYLLMGDILSLREPQSFAVQLDTDDEDNPASVEVIESHLSDIP